MKMIRMKKSRVILFLCVLIFILYLIKVYSRFEITAPTKSYVTKHVSMPNMSSLSVLIIDFETFDNDVAETSASVLSACNLQCNVLILTDATLYPPLKLPKGAQHIIMQPGINHHRPSLSKLLELSTYILLLPDGARVSSTSQLSNHLSLLDASDAQLVALNVGGTTLACHSYHLDIKSWTFVVTPAPHSEACDGVSGRSAFILHTSNFIQYTLPFLRPVGLSIGIQSSARGWKTHILRGGLLGEGRALLGTEHLQWKFQTLETERLKNLYSSLGIKKVVGSNRKVEWFGCTRKTARCFPPVDNDIPSFLYEGKWTPPCCLEGLRAVARHVFKTLRGCRVRWWLEGGSLLGAVRNGDIIPWDKDIDIGVYHDDMDRCPPLKSSRWQTLEDPEGFVWQRAEEGGYFRVQYSTVNTLHVDIFPFVPRGDMMIRGQWSSGHRQDVDFPEHFLRPLSSMNFVGVTASAPNNVRDFLEYKFGMGVIETQRYPNFEYLYAVNTSLPPLI